MSTLAQSVWLEREGELVCFTAGSAPPAWAAKLITNPLVWAEAGVPVEPVAVERIEEGAEEVAKTAEALNEATSAKIPPKSGKGSSAAAWAAYAKANGYEVEDDAKASEIRDALAEAGVPVE